MPASLPIARRKLGEDGALDLGHRQFIDGQA